MKILWEIKLETSKSGAWYPDHEMNFAIFKEKIYHCYHMRDTSSHVKVCVFNNSSEYMIKTYDFGENIGLPSDFRNKWTYQIEADDLFLYAGKRCLNISNNPIVHEKHFKMDLPKPEYIYPNNQKFVFNNRMIHFPKERTAVCIHQETNEILWKHALKGYPYTMIEQKDGCAIFGTAGKGGALYCIDIETGIIKRDVSTKGTVHYCWYEDRILMADEYGHLQLIDPFSDKQIGIVKLKNRLINYSPMIVNEEQLYAITFSNTKKLGVEKMPYITCVSLNTV